MSALLTPNKLVEERLKIHEDDLMPHKVMKENLAAFLHEFSYFTVVEKQEVYDHLSMVSPNAKRALVRVFSV